MSYCCLPLDPRPVTACWLLTALVRRAELLAGRGETEAAAADLRRALAWDPTDAIGAADVLGQLTTPSRQG